MFTKNHLELTGNIAREPETHTVGETTVTKARLLHNETIHRAEGEPLERLVAIDLEIWGKRGEAFADYASTKTPVYVEGKLQLQQWEQEGQPRSRLLVRVEEWQFLLPKSVNAAEELEEDFEPEPPAPRKRSRPRAKAHR